MTPFEVGLAAAWARLAGLVDGSSRHRLGPIQVALLGVAHQTQQVAVLAGAIEAPTEEGDVEAAVVAAEALFAKAGWRPGFDLLAGGHPGLESILRRRGYRVVADRPAMTRDLRTVELAELTAVPAGFTIERARRPDRAGVVVAQQVAFQLDPEMAFAMVPESLFSCTEVDVLVARDADGEIVGTITVHHDDEVAGIIGLAVVETSRGQRIGSALVESALRSAKIRGARSVWLQSTAMAFGLYRRLGFDTIGSAQVWLR